MLRVRLLHLAFALAAALLALTSPEARAGGSRLSGDWSGSETLSGYGRLRFQFPSAGRVSMIDAKETVAGTASVGGGSVRLSFWNGQVIYTGTIKGDTMSGTATNGRNTWSWTVTRQGGSGGAGDKAIITYDNSPGKTTGKPSVPFTPQAAAKRAWGKNADRAAQNLSKDKDLTEALRRAAAGSAIFTEANLRAIVAIESGADRTTGKNRFGYAGLFQMGPAAAKEAGYDYKDISDPSQWRTNIAAGVRYLELNAQRLRKAGVDVTPLNVYLAHQQGAKGATNILRAVQDGSAAKAAASRNELANLPASFVKGIVGGGRQVTVQDYYDYWSAAFRTVAERVTPPPSADTPLP